MPLGRQGQTVPGAVPDEQDAARHGGRRRWGITPPWRRAPDRGRPGAGARPSRLERGPHEGPQARRGRGRPPGSSSRSRGARGRGARRCEPVGDGRRGVGDVLLGAVGEPRAVRGERPGGVERAAPACRVDDERRLHPSPVREVDPARVAARRPGLDHLGARRLGQQQAERAVVEGAVGLGQRHLVPSTEHVDPHAPLHVQDGRLAAQPAHGAQGRGAGRRLPVPDGAPVEDHDVPSGQGAGAGQPGERGADDGTGVRARCHGAHGSGALKGRDRAERPAAHRGGGWGGTPIGR
jgi:hypothetical protein